MFLLLSLSRNTIRSHQERSGPSDRTRNRSKLIFLPIAAKIAFRESNQLKWVRRLSEQEHALSREASSSETETFLHGAVRKKDCPTRYPHLEYHRSNQNLSWKLIEKEEIRESKTNCSLRQLPVGPEVLSQNHQVRR